MRFQVHHALAQPALERRARAVDRVDCGRIEQAMFDEVHGEHFAGPEPALATMRSSGMSHSPASEAMIR